LLLTYDLRKRIFIFSGTLEHRESFEAAGFAWDSVDRAWVTADPYIAYALRKHATKGSAADAIMRYIGQNIAWSSLPKAPPVPPPCPDGMEWYAFQATGVWYMFYKMQSGRRHLLLADEQGLGKTPQAIGLANLIGAKKLLVICPASLRINWVREINAWHMHNPGVVPLLTKQDKPHKSVSIVTSYALAGSVKEYEPDLIIIDEAHYLKNHNAARTQLLLGNVEKGWPGLVDKAPSVWLTGTPTPNGRPSELWPMFYRCAPDAISSMRRWPFIKRFCRFIPDDTEDVRVTGAKNEVELFVRLRGSGLMLRRLKKDVLKDLPPKRYKMVVFPVDSSTRVVIERERAFNAVEIVAHGGTTVGSVLPEIRREMGVAKAPACVNYISDMLANGVDKVVVFAHHLEVVGILAEGLRDFGVEVIVGSTPLAKRQAAVDAFQNDPARRVFIGNEAAEEGWTLTKSADVVLVEPEWVPGKNAQRVDRLHRIGQLRSVLAHLLVVEGSLDAYILSAAARKTVDCERVLDDPLTARERR